MNKEIEFRGKRIDNGEWVYGYYYVIENLKTNNLDHRIYNYYNGGNHIIDKNTLGQYVWIKDKNDNKIYEKDILLVEPLGWKIQYEGQSQSYSKYKSVVEWKLYPELDLDENFKSFREYRCKPFNHSYQSLEIVGNIFDNPNLLEDKYNGIF